MKERGPKYKEKRLEIKEMPSKETLEEYLNGGRGDKRVTVSFNVIEGKFEKNDN